MAGPGTEADLTFGRQLRAIKDNSNSQTRPPVIYSVSLTVLSLINRVSGAQQPEEPSQFYGGIVADPMGLGKTLSMIALIASDIHLDYTDPSSLSGANIEKSSGRTLVIVPPPCRFNNHKIVTIAWLIGVIVLGTWEEQLTE